MRTAKANRRTPRGTAIVLGLTAVIAACSGSAPTGGTGTVNTVNAVATSATADSTATTFTSGENQGDEELGLTEAEIIRRVDATEVLIATCMTDSGFEYFPVDYATARIAMDSDSKPSGLSADEFRTQFGYGITTLFSGPTTQATLSAGELNLRYKAGLATADRVAYDRTLYGENPNATFIVALDQEDFSQVGGCTRAAVELIFSKEELGASFVNYQNAFGALIDSDPRVIAAYRDWSSCMREAGYGYNDPSAIDADLAAKLDNVTRGTGPESLSAEAKSALTELQGEELAIAASDHACELKHVADVKLAVEAEVLGPTGTQP